MRRFSSRLTVPLVLAGLVALLAGCGHAAPEHHTQAPAGLSVASTPPGCRPVSGQGSSGTADGARLVLGVVTVPPAYVPGVVHIPSGIAGSGPWHYWSKWGLGIRAGSPTVVVSVPTAWTQRVAITWGNNAPTGSTIRLPTCPQPPGAWNFYAGGFYLRTSAECVPLLIHVGGRSVTMRFGINRHC